MEYRQGPFAYQGKCLQWIRDHYHSLGSENQARVEAALHGTGCSILCLAA